MRIAHTSDWHMGLRLGYQDRKDDLTRAISKIAAVCKDESVDVLLVCGDLFDDSTRTEVVRFWIGFVSDTFHDFLLGGGTILALTGNHDNENLAQVLRQSMQLAAPARNKPGAVLQRGRFHLFAGPTFFSLAERGDPKRLIQFVAMPSPTVARYLTGEAQRFQSQEERNRALKVAFKQRLDQISTDPAYRKDLQTVLAAHINTTGAEVGSRGHHLSEDEAVVLDPGELPTGYAYVALGDIHKPQTLMGLPHVRYCGSIDRMDLGEEGEDKGLLLVDVTTAGREGEPKWVSLDPTPIYRVEVDDPDQIPTLADKHPDAERALVNLTIRYKAGRDNLPDVLTRLEKIFPRCYARDCREVTNGEATGAAPAEHTAPRSMADTVRAYLGEKLADHPDRDEIARMAEELLQQMETEG